MKKVCENWQEHFSEGKVGNQFYAEFEMRAKAASAEVFRVAKATDAQEIVANLVKFTNAQKVVYVDGPIQKAAGISAELKNLGVTVYEDKFDIAEHAESADIGISAVEFGVAETGSVCMDGFSFESRIVSMLPPLHIVLMNSNFVVPGVTEAFEVFSKTFHQGYVSFITGPSRTADIERVLTIGVHGPSRFVIIAVDEEISGGAN